MNFCRNCGGRIGAPAAQPTPPPQAAAPPPMAPPPAAPPPGQGFGGPPAPGPASGGYGGAAPQGDQSARMPSPSDVVRRSNQTCPNCGGQTPSGFSFCQQCGFRLPPGASAPRAVSGETPARSDQAGSEAIAATLAAPDAARLTPQPHGGAGPATAPAWGSLVSVNRDGTDGARHPLAGEWANVGRPGADVVIEDDRFLAREHARIERSPEGALVTPLDRTNGVFRRIDQPVDIADGDVILAGREVLRFELVGEEEREAAPLVRHGVTVFGSPPREPWGRLVQLLPSGGIRDVRYLDGDEITIGREEGDVVFRDDKFLSRVHAVLRFGGGQCRLEDLKSSNGTFVRMRAPTRIRAGDHLRMGDQLFRFELQ